MRKLNFFLVILLVTISCLTSCTDFSNKTIEKKLYNDTPKSVDSQAVFEEPPTTTTARYASVEELTLAVGNWFSEKKSESITSNLDEKTANTLKKFIEKRVEDNSLLIPMFDEESIVLRDEEGYSNITLFPSELYGQPWIWYHCRVDDTDLIVKMMYIDDETILSGVNSKGVSQVIAEISPTAPNIDNIEKYTNYESITLSNVEFKDFTTEVMTMLVKNDSRIFYAFIYENVLVNIQSASDLLSKDIFSKISFDEIEFQHK